MNAIILSGTDFLSHFSSAAIFVFAACIAMLTITIVLWAVWDRSRSRTTKSVAKFFTFMTVLGILYIVLAFLPQEMFYAVKDKINAVLDYSRMIRLY